MPTIADISAAAGATKTATCAADETAISVASLILPRRATTIAPPCSAALPTIATITIATKKSESPADSPNASSEPTSISETSAVATVATPSTISAVRMLHAAGRRTPR